jgi:glycosyltransferase involved in cell wall biosynthesis
MIGTEASPKVSVCMPVFNGENFIADAIASILGQTFADFELIVTDNASTDGTERIVREAAARDPRVRYVRNPENMGAAENYNIGFRLARGQYVKWAAHDDMLSPDFLERTAAILDANPTVSIAFGRTEFIDDEGRPLAVRRKQMPDILDDDPVHRFFQGLRESGGCFPIFGLFRADELARSCLHRKSYYGSDLALIAEMLILGKLRIDEDAVFVNRVHAGQSVAIRSREEQARWQNGTGGRVSSLKRARLLAHLFEIAGRHPELASPARLRAAVVRFVLDPPILKGLLVDAVQAVSPSAAARLVSIATRRRA